VRRAVWYRRTSPRSSFTGAFSCLHDCGCSAHQHGRSSDGRKLRALVRLLECLLDRRRDPAPVVNAVALLAVRVPNWSSTLCDLGVFVYQPVEQVATSDVRLGWRRRGW
jgi:hypothetical protein